MLIEPQLLEEPQAVGDGHSRQFGDVAAANAHIAGLLAQPGAFAGRAGGLAAVAAGQHAVLDLVALLLHVLEEAVDPGHALGTLPEQAALPGIQLAVGAVDGKVVTGAVADEVLLPLAQLLPAPRRHAVIIDAQALVRDHQVGIDADYAAVPFALRTGAHRVVEAEEVGAGLLEGNAIGFETVAERHLAPVLPEQDQLTLSFEEGGFGAVGRAALVLRIPGHGCQAVHHQEPGAFQRFLGGQQVLDAVHFLAVMDAGIALLLQDVQVFLDAAPLGDGQRRQHEHGAAVRVAVHPGHHVLHGVALHGLATHRADGAPRPGEEELQVVVDLGAGAHRAARVAGLHLLLDGDGRADADDAVHIGLLQAPHELAGIAAQALHVAALALSVEGVEGQRALPAAAQAGDDHQLAAWDLHAHVLQVVHAGAFHADGAVAELSQGFGGRRGLGGQGERAVRERGAEIRDRHCGFRSAGPIFDWRRWKSRKAHNNWKEATFSWAKASFLYHPGTSGST